MFIKIDGKYKTRLGTPVKIWAVGQLGLKSVIFSVLADDNKTIIDTYMCSESGRFFSNGEPSYLDLIDESDSISENQILGIELARIKHNLTVLTGQLLKDQPYEGTEGDNHEF